MPDHLDRVRLIKIRKISAVVYTVTGLSWALLALFSAKQQYKSILLLATVVPMLLLMARFVYIQRDYVDISLILEQSKPGSQAVSGRRLMVVTVGILSAMVVLSLWLWSNGRTDWIVPVVAIVFTIHFYLLPPDLSTWEDLIIASVAAISIIITPFWFPEQSWLWTLVAASACALDCWLAADIRFQRVSALQEEENREIDRQALE